MENNEHMHNDIIIPSGCMEIWNIEDDVDFIFVHQHFNQFSVVQLLELFENDTPFSYIRLGDLEWRVILDNRGNAEHRVFGDIRDRLTNVVRSNIPYHVSFSIKLFETSHVYNSSKQFIEDNNLQYTFIDTDLFNDLIRYNTSLYFDLLNLFHTQFNGRIVHIGNEHITKLKSEVFTPLERVIIPKKNCYCVYEETKQTILDIAERHSDKNLVFLFGASLMSPIMIDELHYIFNGQHYLIDIGSLFDYFLGFASRTPSVCLHDFLWNTYEDLISVGEGEIKDISMSLV